MQTPSSTAELRQTIQPLVANKERSAVLLDVDGTLAPIALKPEQAKVPDPTRELLTEINASYGLLGCVSGRSTLDARAIVGISDLHYVGNHGAELLAPNADMPVVEPQLAEWIGPVRDFTRSEFSEDLVSLGVHLEEKGPISALHYRGSKNEEISIESLRELARRAAKAGLRTQWGRKVLEIRPPLAFDKGSGIEQLLNRNLVSHALYAGDDNTDLDAFRKLTVLKQSGVLSSAVSVGVASAESPATISAEADLIVDGPDGIVKLLKELTTTSAV